MVVSVSKDTRNELRPRRYAVSKRFFRYKLDAFRFGGATVGRRDYGKPASHLQPPKASWLVAGIVRIGQRSSGALIRPSPRLSP